MAVAPEEFLAANGHAEHFNPSTFDASETAAVTKSTGPDISEWCVSRFAGKEPPPLEFAIERIAPKGMVTLLVAEGGVGKTMLNQLAGTAIATGQDFFGLTTMPGAAAGVFAEDPDAVLHIRQNRICDALSIDVSQMAGRFFMLPQVDTPMILWHEEGPTGMLLKLERDLAKISGLQLLTLDNVALLFSGDENNRIEVTAFMSHLNRLASRLDVAILLSTHASKSQDGSTLRLASGSTAWINAARSVIELQKQKENDDVVTLTLRKANHSKPGEIAELVWKDGVLTKPETESGLLADIRLKQVRAHILSEVEKRQDTEQWLSMAPQSRTYGRYLPAVLRCPPTYKENDLKRAAEQMLADGDIEFFTRNKKQGLRKKL